MAGVMYDSACSWRVSSSRLLRSCCLILVMASLSSVCSAAVPSGTALTLWYPKPADKWVEALPIGNGRMGAMVYGGVGHERVQLNEDTIWAGGPYSPANPAAFDAYAKARPLILAGKQDGATALLKVDGLGIPSRQASYQTVG